MNNPLQSDAIYVIINSNYCLLIIALLGIGGIYSFYSIMNRAVSADSENVKFEIKPGTNKTAIIDNLAKQKLIRSKYAGYLYLFVNSKLNMQAGTYNINKSSKMSDIITQISKGETRRSADTIRITFKEGKTIDDYAKIIDANFESITEEDFKNALKDTEFLKLMIDKYWFLTDDILKKDLRYSLEGYLFPQTYDFYLTANSKDIIKVFLNQTEKILNKYKDEIDHNNYTVHEILTIASIIEKEANSKNDRKQVSQVIYTRLEKKMSLGMDVTAFYGAGITAQEFEEIRLKAEKQRILNDNNPYNTRNNSFIGLPIGSICNPSEESIDAALNPNEGKYVYFYAVQGKDYFFETASEFYEFQKSLKS